MRRSRTESALIVECARSHGVSPRAVRDWRKKDDPRWSSFIHSRAKQSTLPVMGAEGPTLSLQEEEEQAARRYAALAAMADAAISRNDTATLPALLKSAELAHALLHKVRENVRATRIAEGDFVSRDVVRGTYLRITGELREWLLTLPEGNLPQLLRPDDAPGAALILHQWVMDALFHISRQDPEKDPMPPGEEISS